MALAQNMDAMRTFSSMSESARQDVIDRFKACASKQEMENLVNGTFRRIGFFGKTELRIHFLVPKASQFLQNSITIPTHLNVILYLYKANKKILDRFLFHNLPASGKDAGPPLKKTRQAAMACLFYYFLLCRMGLSFL